LRPTLLALFLLASPSLLFSQGGAESPPSNQPPNSTSPPPASPTDAQISAAKALADSNQLLSNAKSVEVQANSLINKWKSLPDAPSSTDQAIRILEDFFPAVNQATIGMGLGSQLSSMSSSLKTQGDTLASKQKDLLVGGANTPADNVKDLFDQCDQVSQDLSAEKTNIDGLAQSLTDSLHRNYDFFVASFSAIDSSLSGLLQLNQDESNTETIRQVLESQMSAFALNFRNYPVLSAEWAKFSGKLAAFSASSDAATLAKPVADASTKTQNDLNSILPKFKPWFDALSSAASTLSTTLASDRGKLEADYRSSYSDSLADVSKAKDLHAAIKKVLDAWDEIAAAMPAPAPSGVDLDALKHSVKNLHDQDGSLSTARVPLEDDLSGDRSQWVADSIRLYYFTDVPRLIEILNPDVVQEGGVSEAADKAAAARKDLLNADLSLSDAQAEVNKYQNQLLNLKEQLRQAQAQQQSTAFLFNKTSSLVNRLTGRLSGAQDDANQKSADLNSSDPLKKAAAEQAKTKAESLSSQLDSAKQANDDAQKNRDAAQQNLNTLQDQQQGLPAQIKAAQASLEDAQATVNKLRNASIVAAQNESEAFAAARDHTPHLKTVPVAGSTDPAHRVEIFGFTDSKTIFLRGSRPDVDAVKGIVAQFDQPSPQARISIWSLQLNSAGNPNDNKATQRFNTALSRIETELAATRGLVAAALSLLRETIGKHVNNDAVNACAAAVPTNAFSSDSLRVCRLLNFYEEEVLWRLAGKPDDPGIFGPVSRRTIPDPAAVTTLGEGLMVLSLAKRELRRTILCEFESNLGGSLSGLGLYDPADYEDSKNNPLTAIGNGGRFALLERALGVSCGAAPPPPPSGHTSQLTSRQFELIHALRARAAVNLTKSIETLALRLAEVQAKLSKTPDDTKRIKYVGLQKSLQGRLAPLLLFAYEQFNISVADFTRQLRTAIATTNNTVLAQIDAASSAATGEAFSTLDPLRTANARVAAADEMLKETMIAAEDDLDRLFIHPMLDRLRLDLTRSKELQVGVLQRTSILATNRLVANVDPRASAQLGLGEETDILQSLLQLGEVFVAAKTGGPIAALNSLNAQKREAPPEIYALNTGSQFKVTPIFDPSGQALRFQFDYVSGTQIREPNGTTNPQLPRIERHNINTEVQISNMEMREISRFEANSKLGIPTTYSGGVPILKDIPYVRPWVPLLGWFVRKKGEAAASQESVIFGQTTIYPTIADIADLLTSEDSGPN